MMLRFLPFLAWLACACAVVSAGTTPCLDNCAKVNTACRRSCAKMAPKAARACAINCGKKNTRCKNSCPKPSPVPSPRPASPRPPPSCQYQCATVRNTCVSDSCTDLVGVAKGRCLKECGADYTKCTKACPPPPPPPAGSVEVELSWNSIRVLDDGESSGVAEPYLWTAFFKIDQTNTDIVGLGLKVKPGATLVTLAGDGRHGNLPEMDSSKGPNTKPISSTFTYRTILQPFTPLPKIKAAIIGSVSVLLEEDGVTDDGALAGAQAFRAGIEKELQKIVNGLTLTGTVQIPDLTAGIEKVKNAVIAAIQDEQSFFENLGTLIGSPDDFLGSQVVIATVADGIAGGLKGTVNIPNQTLTNKATINSPIMNAGPDGKWQLLGYVKRIKNN